MSGILFFIFASCEPLILMHVSTIIGFYSSSTTWTTDVTNHQLSTTGGGNKTKQNKNKQKRKTQNKTTTKNKQTKKKQNKQNKEKKNKKTKTKTKKQKQKQYSNFIQSWFDLNMFTVIYGKGTYTIYIHVIYIMSKYICTAHNPIYNSLRGYCTLTKN